MNFKENLLFHLDEATVSAILSSQQDETVHGVLLQQEKISDEEFLSLCKSARPHPFVKHAYLYDKKVDDLGKSLLYDTGAISIQDPASMMVAHLLDVKPGDIVLDMCAAPGGKTLGAAFSMKGEGVILANDLSYERARDLSQNIERAGVGNVVVCSNDFSRVYRNFLQRFDKIILDAPCSGSAMFRKNDLAEKDWNEQKVLRCASIQKELLEMAYEMLKDGGILSYSTCSFSYEENEAVLLDFLSSHHDCHALPGVDHPSVYHGKDLKEGNYFFPHLFEGEGQFSCLIQKGNKLPSPTIKTVAKPLKKQASFLDKFGLGDRSNELIGNVIYSLSQAFNVKGLSLLRYGVKVAEDGPNLIPDHHLSHFLDSSYSIPLSEAQMKAYIAGETFQLSGENGFVPVSYQSRNLGFVKLVNGMAKNHYPKGLRRR